MYARKYRSQGPDTSAAPSHARGDAVSLQDQKSVTMPVGVVIRRRPGVTRWAKWVWTPVAILPGAGPADWKVLREEGETVEFHAATVPLTLYRGEAEAYMVALSQPEPPVFVILRQGEQGAQWPYHVHMVTASPHEALLYSESGEEIVERIAMPKGLLAWVGSYTKAHYVEETFVKRKRRQHLEDKTEDGIGDPRISQASDVYRAPGSSRKAGET
ncbi:Protein of unknown function [Puniceibacterium sediminis]|uniref:DUF3305 domain-containing protein n=1 Tax=Puniceibacterium sediminis TaxID=1608407 RepID=A0A238XSW9_9RHOB|nr:Protein of unknown function [Puniceibacterium sediminis]